MPSCSLCHRCDPSCGLVDVSYYGHPAFGLVCRDPAACSDAYIAYMEAGISAVTAPTDYLQLVLDQKDAVRAALRHLAATRRE